ncbi:triphosphoribosyl-dephospho-CoA synthase CitG [Komagataeibacter sp. SM21]|uniref:triphosphoribosyl-dephospho-CoA synthase CitG n=1 Tax=Komagataeibacter sp. SM21 TaxID=3242899 RepID=UPI00352970AD
MTAIMTIGEIVSEIARKALVREIDLTPKPGLVDRHDSGAHRDMDYPLFLCSIEAISPFFERFYQQGCETAFQPPDRTLSALRATGLACERRMFQKTGGINTHKGSIFSLGLLCGAAGRVVAGGQKLGIERICTEVAYISKDITLNDFRCQGNISSSTAGEKIYRRYGLAGARGEAESGFVTVRTYALPAYLSALSEHGPSGRADLVALLSLISKNEDTNIISRAGLAGLDFSRKCAEEALNTPSSVDDESFFKNVFNINEMFIDKNISPGGSADLLSVLFFLTDVEAAFSKM